MLRRWVVGYLMLKPRGLGVFGGEGLLFWKEKFEWFLQPELYMFEYGLFCRCGLKAWIVLACSTP